MSDEQTIRGQTTMTWADQARIMGRLIVRYLLIFIVLMTIALFMVWAATSSDRQWLLLRHQPLAALSDFAAQVWPILLGGFVLVLLLLIGAYARAFYRLPVRSRRLSYEVTSTSLVTRDDADFALTVPWSMVVRVRNSEYVMRIKLPAGIWRTVFWRAFAPDDRAQVLRWAQQTPQRAAATSAAAQPADKP
jgi:hypothetical protein